jgi:hypothetical protein
MDNGRGSRLAVIRCAKLGAPLWNQARVFKVEGDKFIIRAHFKEKITRGKVRHHK